MMRLDGRRLVRAAGLALALFLLVGGGAGFVMAAGQGDDVLLVPAPAPGDRAVYTTHEVLFNPDLPRTGAGSILLDKVAFEWLPERQVQDSGFRTRVSHPLRAEYVFAEGTPQESRQVAVIDYDAATGQPIQRQTGDSFDWCGSNGPGVNCIGLGGYEVHEDYRYDWLDARYAPCGMLSSLQGKAHGGGPITVPGACDWPGGPSTQTYLPTGWKEADATLGLERRFSFRNQAHADLALSYDSTSPFPARLGTPLDDLFTSESDVVGRYWDLRRVEATRGSGHYAPVADDGAPPQTVPLQPRTPWTIDETGLALEFPLADAYAAALAQPTPAPDAAGTAPQPSAGDWVPDHPRSYVPFAMRLETVDRNGARHPSWLILWVEGDAWLGKQVFLEPATVQGVASLPEAAGRSVVVRDWTPSWLPRDRSAYFPRLEQMPADVPSPAALMERYTAANPGRPANRYGFETVCRGQGCGRVDLYVEVGTQAEREEDALARFGAGLERTSMGLDKLRVDGQGRAVLRTSIAQEQTGSLVARPDGEGAGPQATAAAVPSAAWVLPAAPAAATGISLLALAGAALYYFWPALKGAASFGLFSRIEGDQLLDHPVRRAIADAIDGEPGIHFLALSRKVGAGRGALEHHLRKMTAAGLVTRQQAAGYTCYFPKGKVDRHLMAAAASLRSDGSRAILQAVAATPGASSRDLAARLGLAPSTISYHLKRLEQAGLVAPGVRSGVQLTALGSQASATEPVA